MLLRLLLRIFPFHLLLEENVVGEVQFAMTQPQNPLVGTDSPASPIAKTSKRTRLSLTEKVEAADLLKSGKKISEVMQRFNISRRTVSNIKSNVADLVRRASESSLPSTRKTFRETRYSELDAALKLYVSTAEAGKLRIKTDMLRIRALFEKQRILDRNPENQVKSFVASKGWIDAFFKRNCKIDGREKRDQGEAMMTNKSSRITIMRDALNDFPPDRIFNVSETGLFYRLFPRHSYSFVNDNIISVRRTKYMTTEDRISVYVCTNADASIQIPITMIGSQKEPPSFRLSNPSVPYLYQKNAWSDGHVFNTWLEDIFLPTVRRTTSEPIVLLMDPSIVRCCDDYKSSDTKLHLFQFPPNVATMHQPVERGVISAWKALYRYTLMKELSKDLEGRVSRREHSRMLLPELRGMEEGFEPNLLEVSEMIQESWRQVSTASIISCWLRADILPRSMQGILQNVVSTAGPLRFLPDQDMLNEIQKMLETSRPNIDPEDPLYSCIGEMISYVDVERWIELELDPEIIEALVNDVFDTAQERLVASLAVPLSSDVSPGPTADVAAPAPTSMIEPPTALPTSTSATVPVPAVGMPPSAPDVAGATSKVLSVKAVNVVPDMEIDDVNGEGLEKSKRLPSKEELLEMFARLENIAYECNISIASHHLRKARNALLQASSRGDL